MPWGARHDKPNVWPMAYERPAMSVERLLACGQRRRETQTAAYRPDRRRPLGTLPLVPGARRAGQRAARGSRLASRRGAARPDETQENILDILNTSTSFPYNGHRFRVGVDDGRTCDCGHIADSLLDRWRHLYAVGALITAANN